MKQTIHGFTLQKTQKIPELKTTANLYIHAKTKAQLLSLVNSDENKSFGITFRTPPTDSTGIAHILEHSVLCGSKNYPLKEPFIELVKGSLNTFLNAFTFPDKTSYPVASTNEKDFYNLVRVYLDAVFFPLLSKETLMQEGWHIHQEKSSETPAYRGIVYNEMKGAYSSPDGVLWDAIRMSLLPDTPYAHDSGGDPLVIPELTYEDFIAFHATYYHPSNSLIYFSGNDSEQSRLQLADEYLSQYEYKAVDSAIPLQKSFHTPIEKIAPLPISANEDPLKKAMTTVNWVLPSAQQRDLSLRLKILSFILSGTPASPVRKKLIESGLGEDVAGGGIESDLQQMIYSIGLKGMDERQAPRVEQIVLDTLRSLVASGISQDAIDAAMNTTEFSLREQNTGSFPRGLSMLYGILPSWLYGGDPFQALSFAGPMQQLKGELAAGEKIFETLIQKYFLDNTHRSTVILHPDVAEQARRDALEIANVAARVAALSESEREALVPTTQKLIALQTATDSEDALAKLPKLTVADLPKTNMSFPTEVIRQQEFELLTHPTATNGIVYLDLVFDLRAVPQRLVPLISLFSRTLIEMGTAHESYDKFMHRINKQSGGIWTQVLVGTKVGTNDTVAKIIVRSKWLEEQAKDVTALLSNALLHANLGNKDRFLQLVLEDKSDLESEVLESGHSFVDSRLRRKYRVSDQVDEELSGINQLFFLRSLVDRVKTDWKSVKADLETLRGLIITQSKMIANVTSDPELIYLGADLANSISAKLPARALEVEAWAWDVEAEHNELLNAPTTVNYVGRGINLFDTGYNLDGSAILVSRYLRTSWLWEQVRMKGGAYGAFSAFDSITGTFTFLSYRDPHIEETLGAFNGSMKFLQELVVTEGELTKAIIGAISDVDRYVLPDAAGFIALTRHLIGMTDGRRQKIRDQILSASEKDFHIFGKVLEALRNGPTVVVSSQKDAIQDLHPTVIEVL